jgi:hypothetical protein
VGIGGVQVAVGFASSTDNFDGNVDALTIAHITTKTIYNFEPPCQESDGNGNFQGQQQDNFQFDNDGCKDGDQNNVQSNNRGDGQSFQSTSINTVKMDTVANTLTITGIGVSKRVPVSFVFAAGRNRSNNSGLSQFRLQRWLLKRRHSDQRNGTPTLDKQTILKSTFLFFFH